MKKFLFLTSFFVVLLLTLIGCGNNKNIENYLSEITLIYFQGEDSDGKLNCSISVGKREEPYIVDGVHHPTCNFSLVCVKTAYFGDEIYAEIEINSIKKDLTLFFNPLNSTYINDLGYALCENDKIYINFFDERVLLYNISKDFGVDYKGAISICENLFHDEIENLFFNRKFQGECYLKVLSNLIGDGQVFWYFSLQTVDNKTFSALISVVDGRVVGR